MDRSDDDNNGLEDDDDVMMTPQRTLLAYNQMLEISVLQSRFTSLHGKLALECKTTKVSVVKTIRLHR